MSEPLHWKFTPADSAGGFYVEVEVRAEDDRLRWEITTDDWGRITTNITEQTIVNFLADGPRDSYLLHPAHREIFADMAQKLGGVAPGWLDACWQVRVAVRREPKTIAHEHTLRATETVYDLAARLEEYRSDFLRFTRTLLPEPFDLYLGETRLEAATRFADLAGPDADRLKIMARPRL